MSKSSGLRDLGRRVRARRGEARLDLVTLAALANVPASALDSFEEGLGGLGVPALMRIANVLGVPPTSFVHTDAPVVHASVEPSIVLKTSAGAAWLNDRDREALIAALRRARAFAEIGELLGVERNADRFNPCSPPTERPFLPGVDAAVRVRALLPERPGPLRGLARLLEDRFNILVLRHAFSDDRVLGAACRSGAARLIAVNAGIESETTRRFALAHELGHHIFDLDENGATADEGDVARIWFDNPPREKRANAFAAMLIAPDAVVAEVAGAPRPVSRYDDAKRLVDLVRTHVGMGFAATAWHLHNRRYIEDDRLVHTLLLAEPDADPLKGFEEDTAYDGLHRRVYEALSRDLISRARARELLGEDDLATFESGRDGLRA